MASAVSTGVTGTDDKAKFNNTVNKKLACCLNYETGGFYAKFDCIETAKNHYSDFNALWQSVDTTGAGGQSNAMSLANSQGKLLTGFYTLKGTRCNEFSEFAGPITPARVNPSSGTTTQMDHAAGGAGAVQTIAGPTLNPPASLKPPGAKLPTTAADRLRCPILVRAAFLAKCPDNPVVDTAPRRSYTDSSGVVHCSHASSLQVQVRVEQITEIASMPRMKPEDTVVDAKNASAISIDQIIANKYGNQCPSGTHRQGDACVED